MKQVNSVGSCASTNVVTAQFPELRNKDKIKNKTKTRNVSSKISKSNNKQLVIQKQWKKTGTMQTRFAIPNKRPLRRQLDEDEKQHRKAIQNIKACLHCKCRGIKVCELMNVIIGTACEEFVYNIRQCGISRPCNSCSIKYHDWSWNPCDFENILGIVIDFGKCGIEPYESVLYQFYTDIQIETHNQEAFHDFFISGSNGSTKEHNAIDSISVFHSLGQTSSALNSYPLRFKGIGFETNFPQSLRSWFLGFRTPDSFGVTNQSSKDDPQVLRNDIERSIEVLLNISDIFIEQGYNNVSLKSVYSNMIEKCTDFMTFSSIW